jgi:hypothetical protein
VYSEIRASIDPRSTVKQHILQHLDNFIAIQTRWEETPSGGRVLVQVWGGSGEYVALEESRAELFVHPITGIVLLNRRYVSWQQRATRQRDALDREKQAMRRVISEFVQLHCIDGIWYEVELDTVPLSYEVPKEMNGGVKKKVVHAKCWDVLRKRWIECEPEMRVAYEGGNQGWYGRGNLYAKSKRQLNSKELQQYNLVSSAGKQKVRKGLLLLGHQFLIN